MTRAKAAPLPNPNVLRAAVNKTSYHSHKPTIYRTPKELQPLDGIMAIASLRAEYVTVHWTGIYNLLKNVHSVNAPYYS